MAGEGRIVIVLWFIAVIAVSLAVGTWFGIRFEQSSQQLDAEVARLVARWGE